MNGKRTEYKRHTQIGPGGMNCACCGPAPGKDRKQTLRTSKRRERQAWKRQARKDANQ